MFSQISFAQPDANQGNADSPAPADADQSGRHTARTPPVRQEDPLHGRQTGS